MNFRLSYFDRFTALLLWVLVIYFGMQALFYPILGYDENYYVYATHHMLGGDWFLQNLGFDKPFLHPLLIVLSRTIFGDHFVGYRALGFLMFACSFWIYRSAFNRIFLKINNNVDSFSRLLIVNSTNVFLFLNFVTIANGASCMAESFLFFFTGIFIRFLPLEKEEIKNFFLLVNIFVLSFWIKGTVLFLLPIVLIIFYKKVFYVEIKNNFKKLFVSILLSAIAFWYMIVGKEKLLPLKFIFETVTGKISSNPYNKNTLERFSDWLSVLQQSFHTTILVVFIVAILSYLIIFFADVAKKKNHSENDYLKKILHGFNCSVALFLTAIFFTSIAPMPRFIMAISPVFSVLFIFSLCNFSKFRSFNVMYLSVCLSCLYLQFDKMKVVFKEVYNEANIDYTQFAIRNETSKYATLISPDLIWTYAANIPNDLLIVGSHNSPFLLRHQYTDLTKLEAFSYNSNKIYIATEKKDSDNFYFSHTKKVSSNNISFDEDDIKKSFLNQIMATNEINFSDFVMSKRERQLNPPEVGNFSFEFEESHSGVELSMRLNFLKPVLNKNLNLSIKGVLVITQSDQINSLFRSNSNFLGLRIEKVIVDNFNYDITKYIILIKKSLTIPLFNLGPDHNFSKQIEIVNKQIKIRSYLNK